MEPRVRPEWPPVRCFRWLVEPAWANSTEIHVTESNEKGPQSRPFCHLLLTATYRNESTKSCVVGMSVRKLKSLPMQGVQPHETMATTMFVSE